MKGSELETIAARGDRCLVCGKIFRQAEVAYQVGPDLICIHCEELNKKLVPRLVKGKYIE